MNGYNFPVISLEVEGMKHSIKVALSKYSTEISAEIQSAVDDYCNSENIKFVIEQAVFKEINECIKIAVHDFYASGEGREIIKESVIKRLKEN